MASKKARLLEQALQAELHPFAARKLTPLPEASRETPSPEGLETLKRENAKALSSKKAKTRNSEIAKTLKSEDVEVVFDLNQEATETRGIPFTQDELDALYDLKRDLRKGLDLRVNQYDIVRIGVHTMIEDYRRNGEKSIVVQKAKTKIRRG
jgi:hypothetical protein